MNKEKILVLLEHMRKDSVSANSSKGVCRRAHRKAEKLSDPALFPLLRDIIGDNEGKEKKELRTNAYFIITSLLKKAMIPEYCQFILDRLSKESDKYILSSMLDGIAQLHIPEEVNLDALIECTKSDKWLVRHSAINALRASDSECSREAACYWAAQSDEKAFKYEIIYANASLAYIGELEDVHLLERHINSGIPDIRESVLFAIKCIKARNNENG